MDSGKTLVGTIKSFNPKTTYGFINEKDSGDDVFFGMEALPPEFRIKDANLNMVGQEVYFEIGHNPKNGKVLATKITCMGGPLEQDFLNEDSHLTKGTVKSWQEAKGFGFMKVDGLDHDVYFARDRLPQSLRRVRKLMGTMMLFEMREMDNGKYQAHNMKIVSPPGERKRQREDRNDDNSPAKRKAMGTRSNVSQPSSRPTVVSKNQLAYQGTVKSYNSKSGYGFIVADKVDGDVIFFGNDCVKSSMTSKSFEQGNEVMFNLTTSNKGKPQAIDVTSFSNQRSGGVITRTQTRTVQGRADRPIQAPKLATRKGQILKTKPNTMRNIKALCDTLSAQDLTNISAYVSKSLQQKLQN